MTGIIAWRNVWRSRNRSLVVIAAIALGIWALTFAVGFMNSFIVSYLDNAISAQYSHLQLHHPGFAANREAQYSIPDGTGTVRQIRAMPQVRAASARTLVSGMIASSKTAAGITVNGIVPEHEARVTRLDSILTEGTYFAGTTRNPLLISTRLADKLGVKLKSKVVVTFQNSRGDITSAAFRIVGIFNSPSPAVNEGTVYVPAGDLDALLLNDTTAVHEIAVMLKDAEQIEPVINNLRSRFGNVDVESWRELAPELGLMVEQSSVSQYILLGVIMVALAFSIVNTMLMAVLERVRELGMLMAVGMNRRRVFVMIMLETLMLAVVGTPVGLLLGWATMLYFGHTGLDLSAYAAGLESWGYSKVIYPTLGPSGYFSFAAGVFVTALLGSIYPAVKAIRLKPVEAIRTL